MLGDQQRNSLVAPERPEFQPQPHLPQLIAQPAAGFFPRAHPQTLSQPQRATLIRRHPRRPLCPLRLCADSAVSAGRHCACCPSTIRKQTLESPLTVLFSFYFFFLLAAHSIWEQNVPSSSPDHWRGGRSDASCCRALPFLLLSPRLIGVRRVCWSIFNSILLVRGHFWIKGNQIERRNHFHPPPGGGALGDSAAPSAKRPRGPHCDHASAERPGSCHQAAHGLSFKRENDTNK